MEDKQYAAKLGNDVERQATKPLEIVHSSVCGPMKNKFMGGAKIYTYSICSEYCNPKQVKNPLRGLSLHLYALLCIMLTLYIFTPLVMGCCGLVFMMITHLSNGTCHESLDMVYPMRCN